MDSNSTDQGPSPAQVSLEEAYISATLNSTMLYILLQGLYTITYIGAAYLYSTRNTTHKKYVLYFMHALFALGMSQMTIQWYFLKYIFVDKGDTRETIFAASTIIKPSIQVGTIVIQYMQFVLANAFLVWRCYYMENYSLRAVSPMLALLAGEVVTYFVATIFTGNATSGRGPESLHQSSLAQDSLNVLITATSILTSIYIARSLINQYIANPTVSIKEKLDRDSFYVGPQSVVNGAAMNAKKPLTPRPPNIFDKTLDVFLQCSVMWPITQLALTIVSLMQTLHPSTRMFAVVSYVAAINNTVGGLAPTIMIAQLAAIKGKKKKEAKPVAQRSALQFNAPAGNGTTFDASRGDTRQSVIVSLSTGVQVVDPKVAEKPKKLE